MAELSAQWSRSEFRGLQPYNNELSIGGGVHTTGWDVNVTYGFIKHNSRTLQFTASFSEIKHLKEKISLCILSFYQVWDFMGLV